jgi:thioredoxin-dependent peroxiredoxin
MHHRRWFNQQGGGESRQLQLPSHNPRPDRQNSLNEQTSTRLSARVNVNVTGVQWSKDETPGCTAEACAFRDNYEVFTEAGAEVIGISSDSVESHEEFAAHHRLPFVLVSDRDGAVRKRYQVPTTLGLLPGRVTYVIDQQGIIRYMFAQQMNAAQHVENALRIVRELREA